MDKNGVPNGIRSYLESRFPPDSAGGVTAVFGVPTLRGRSECNIRRSEDSPVAERLE
jgi:hypothetical protein